MRSVTMRLRRSPGRAPRSRSRRPARIRSPASRRPAPRAVASRTARIRIRSVGPGSIGHAEPDAVIANVERDHVAHVGQRQAGARRRGVLRDVGQCLLCRPQERDLDFGLERDDVAGDGHVDRDPVEVRPFRGDRGQRLGQGRGLECGRDGCFDRSTRLPQALACEPLGVIQVAVAVGWPVAAPGRRLRAG